MSRAQLSRPVSFVFRMSRQNYSRKTSRNEFISRSTYRMFESVENIDRDNDSRWVACWSSLDNFLTVCKRDEENDLSDGDPLGEQQDEWISLISLQLWWVRFSNSSSIHRHWEDVRDDAELDERWSMRPIKADERDRSERDDKVPDRSDMAFVPIAKNTDLDQENNEYLQIKSIHKIFPNKLEELVDICSPTKIN